MLINGYAIRGLQKSGKSLRKIHTFGGKWLLLILMISRYKVWSVDHAIIVQIFGLFGYLALWLRAKNMAKWGIPEKSIKNVAQSRRP